jgi:SPP1 gp7 family putative phage head morphogenesis protein
MSKEIIFPDQKVIDNFGDKLNDAELNDSMMQNYLKPLFTFVNKAGSFKKMSDDYANLFWKFNTAKYYDRFAQIIFLSILHGYNSMYAEQGKPFMQIKNHETIANYEKYLREPDEETKQISFKDIFFALNLTPEKAVAYFEKKGIKISNTWREALKNSRLHAFTITKVMSADILKDFKELLEKAIREGTSLANFKEQIKNILANRGWLGRKISEVPGQEKIDSPWRLELVYRTNLQSAFNHGRWDRVQDTRVTFPYVQFLSTIDKVTTKECVMLHLTTMSIGDKNIRFFLPPGHYHCRRRFRVLNDTLMKKNGLKVVSGASMMAYRNMEGFEFSPMGKWNPDWSKYPPEIINQLKKRA